MNADFPRILTLLRKERGLSQKQVAQALGVSQALLSHYEKGIRECGLDFLCRCAEFYGVSCDYLLGRTADKDGRLLSAEDLPEPENMGKENITKGRGSILPVLNKKLIANSLNILFDLLQKSNNKGLIQEVSSFLMVAVYRMFRVLYEGNEKNLQSLFSLPTSVAQPYAQAAMAVSCANSAALAKGEKTGEMEPVEEPDVFSMNTETLHQQYPLFASSMLNLIKNAEDKIKKIQ